MDRLIISPQFATRLAVVLAAVMLVVVLFGAVRRDQHRYPVSTHIEPCALVLTRNGHEARCR